MNRRTFAGAAALSALAPRSALAAFGDLPIAGQLNFALCVPLTGPNLRDGEQIANGVRQAIDDTNRYRAPVDKIYGFRTFDDQNQIADGILEAQFAVSDPTLLGAIGHLKGTVTDQASRVYAQARMALVVPATTYEPVTNHNYGTVFRLPTKDSTEGRLAAKMIAQSSPLPKNVVVVTQDGDYGGDVAFGFLQQAQSDKLAAKQVTFAWEKPNYQAAAANVMASNPDLVYLAGNVGDMGPIIPALRAAGYKAPFTASQGFFSQTTIDKYGAAVEQMVLGSSMPPLYLAPSDYRIKRDYELRYGPMTPLAAFGYAAAQILIGAVKRSGGFDRASVARAIASTGSFDTAVGNFQFGADGDPLDPNLYFYTIKDGKWAYVKAAHPSAFILK